MCAGARVPECGRRKTRGCNNGRGEFRQSGQKKRGEKRDRGATVRRRGDTKESRERVGEERKGEERRREGGGQAADRTGFWVLLKVSQRLNFMLSRRASQQCANQSAGDTTGHDRAHTRGVGRE